MGNKTLGKDWALYEYNAQVDTYKALKESDTLTQGKAYWLIQVFSAQVIIDLQGTASTGTASISLETRSGTHQWNMIGSPLTKSLPLGESIISTEGGACPSGCTLREAKQKALIASGIWRYNPDQARYENVSDTENWSPWVGYWMAILSNADGTRPRLTLRDGIISNNELSMKLTKIKGGISIDSIKSGATELLNPGSQLFDLTVSNLAASSTHLTSQNGWTNITLNEGQNRYTINFSDPTNSNLPDSLQVTASIEINNEASTWDISVEGIGNRHSLINIVAPKLRLKPLNGGKFLLPKYSGQLVYTDNEAINREMHYPTGWESTMQFLAYYNDSLGVYLGNHDPKASSKKFIVKKVGDSIEYSTDIIVPNKTLANNNWALSGSFSLNTFKGNWFDAAQIYKQWASTKAEFWPTMTTARIQRQKALGRIGIWGFFMENLDYSLANMEHNMNDYINYFAGIPVGFHWYKWNNVEFDSKYPNYFPEREGMAEMVSRIQQSGDAYIMPYINGRLFDTSNGDYGTKGYPYATKDAQGNIFSQDFNNNHFAVMDPTQTPWQDVLIDASQQLTSRIGSHGIYLDQVAASSTKQCMDSSHNHPLGGGHWWRDGYNQMFSRIHQAIPNSTFVTVEGGNDYLIDQVDGFLTQGWTSNDLVPAFQAVYSGKVQLIGRQFGTGEYNNDAFYAKLAQAFVGGTQLGRTSLWMIHDPNATVAAPFIKRLATMRYKLKDFLAFGELLKPVTLIGNIPSITSTWTDYGTPIDVTIDAIQASAYKNETGDTIAFIFVNASRQEPINFSFDFDANQYTLDGDLEMQMITPQAKSEFASVQRRFSKEIRLGPLDSVAFLIKSH
jgi:hypothetical protein